MKGSTHAVCRVASSTLTRHLRRALCFWELPARVPVHAGKRTKKIKHKLAHVAFCCFCCFWNPSWRMLQTTTNGRATTESQQSHNRDRTCQCVRVSDSKLSFSTVEIPDNPREKAFEPPNPRILAGRTQVLRSRWFPVCVCVLMTGVLSKRSYWSWVLTCCGSWAEADLGVSDLILAYWKGPAKAQDMTHVSYQGALHKLCFGSVANNGSHCQC